MKFACKFFFYYLVVVLATIQCAKGQPATKGSCEQCKQALQDSWNYNGFCDSPTCRFVANNRGLTKGSGSVFRECRRLCDNINFSKCSIERSCQNRGFICGVDGMCMLNRRGRRQLKGSLKAPLRGPRGAGAAA